MILLFCHSHEMTKEISRTKTDEVVDQFGVTFWGWGRGGCVMWDRGRTLVFQARCCLHCKGPQKWIWYQHQGQGNAVTDG